MSSQSRPPLARIAAVAAVAALLVGYPLLAHRIAVSSDAAFWGTLWAVAPLVSLLFWLAWRSRRPGLMLGLWVTLLAALVHSWPQIQSHPNWVYFIQHLGANVLLLLSMGLTLLPGRQPLCSLLAARARGPLPAEVAAYTRGVTVAWTLFFGLMAITSALLFWLATVEIWSSFANLLTAPLVLLMFLGEYGVRVLVLPPEKRSGLLEALRAYWGYGRDRVNGLDGKGPEPEMRAPGSNRAPPPRTERPPAPRTQGKRLDAT